MKWTRAEDITKEIERLWMRGDILRALVGKSEAFPFRLRLRVPTVGEFASHFAEIDEWERTLRELTSIRIEWRTARSPVVGRRSLPSELWIDTPADAVRWLAKQEEADIFLEMHTGTQMILREVLPWLVAHPHRVLAARAVWERVLRVVRWKRDHPESEAIYLRQLDLAGIDTKFVEANTALLGELFDFLSLPCVDDTAGVDFCTKYGFLREPPRLRFRILDPEIGFLSLPGCPDVELDVESFCALQLKVERVIVIENKTTYLVMPQTSGTLAIFGAGYSALLLGRATWLRNCNVFYWGDIDTHGFEILSRLRGVLPHVKSILMDEATLLAFHDAWAVEPTQFKTANSLLTGEEQALLLSLQEQRFGERVRLEQERIPLDYALSAIPNLNGTFRNNAGQQKYGISGALETSARGAASTSLEAAS
jgi:hypothetical protein